MSETNPLGSTSAPSLINLLNTSQQVPFRLIIHRPYTFMGNTLNEYQFRCTPFSSVNSKTSSTNASSIVSDSAPSVIYNQYKCILTIKKLATDQGGLQHTQEEYKIENHVYLIRHTDHAWVWYIDTWNQSIIIDPPITMSCTYSTRTQKWRILGSNREINTLFTMNKLGDGLGLFSKFLADTHEVEFMSSPSLLHPFMSIRSMWQGHEVAHSSMYEGHTIEYDMQESQESAQESKHVDELKNNNLMI
ncbi:MAG: hypothetical protein Sylvanvirus19_4 [Sylvanvirus sp.]|uniref:Uncharacterized protein n=1 Tax=Sylvanvirus sp. TaxID=2487774 RepID=A0A3G5AK31_9VIRU|nr:MAG: hypothetical protein Sylvanvirus19_4 [Sylvanvirus sp.]